MFQNASSFVQPIGAWDTSSVTKMNSMFWGTPFNSDIGGWNTGNVTTMSTMFYNNTNFNQNIGGWNTAKVTAMNSMFNGAGSFNQDIGGWDTSSVTTLVGMFQGASAFDQDLGRWNISKVTIFTSMMLSSGITTPNYDAMLIGFSKQTVIPNISFSASGRKYSAGTAASARAVLTGAPNSWTISDGGVNTTYPTSGTFDATSNLTSSGATLNWTTGSSPNTATGSLQYYVCRGASAIAIDTVNECLAATQVLNWSTATTSVNVSGLAAATTYYYNVILRDSLGYRVIYPGTTVVTP
jgi:surface protein